MTKLWQVGVGVAVSGLVAVPAQGALVISEVLYNEVGSDTGGEFIEIYNNGASSINLTDFKVGDEETSGGTGVGEAMHVFPSGASIDPGEVQVIARDATVFATVYGFNPTYEAIDSDATVPNLTIYAPWDPDGTAFNMANGGDHLLLMDTTDTLVDGINWGTANGPLNPAIADGEVDGQSYERINANVDTDTAGDWQLGPTSDTASERSTPGQVTIPEPTATAGLLAAGILGFVRRRR